MLFQSFHAVFKRLLFKQAKWYSYIPAQPRALSKVFRGLGGLLLDYSWSCTMPLKVLGVFVTGYYDSFKAWFVSLDSALSFPVESSSCPLSVWAAPSSLLLLYMKFLNTFFFWVWSSLFFDCLFQDMHIESLSISVYWYLFLWSFALSYSDKNRNWEKKSTLSGELVICKLVVCCL